MEIVTEQPDDYVPQKEPLYTVEQISSNSLKRLGVFIARRRLYRWIASGKLSAVRIGGRLYIVRSELCRVIPHWADEQGPGAQRRN